MDQLQAVADVGYYNGDTLKACEEGGIEAFVPEPNRGKRLDKEGRFALDAFAYDAAAGVYRCPAGQLLAAMRGGRTDVTGKLRIRYISRRSVCTGCALRAKCLSAKGRRRVIERWEHDAVIERHRARMAGADKVMQRRKALAEHPFGTLKCRAGYRHFLVRGLAKVRGELGLMVLCYNLTRLLNIIGLEKLIAWLAARSSWLQIWLLRRLTAAFRRARAGFYRWRNQMPAPAGRPTTFLTARSNPKHPSPARRSRITPPPHPHRFPLRPNLSYII